MKCLVPGLARGIAPAIAMAVAMIVATGALPAVAAAGEPGEAACAEPAAPRRHWWNGIGAWIGHREVSGVGRASGRSYGLGYHLDLGDYGIDVAVLNLQRGHDEGIQTAARAAAFVDFERWLGVGLWSGAGLSYGWAKGWSASTVPKRTGRGAQLELLVGMRLARLDVVRIFAQAAVTVPLYRLEDQYRSSDSAVRVVGYELALGLGF